MALSKPLFDLLGSYFQQLYMNPVRTKSVSSCVIAAVGNLTSQYVAGNKTINQDSVLAFALFGLLFGGTVPHYFYMALDKTISRRSPLKQLLVERLLYTPLLQAFSLYMLTRFEGHSHEQAVDQLAYLYKPILRANWRWLTVLQYLNLAFVPPMLRVLVANLIGFFWIVYLSMKRRQAKDQKGRAK